MPAGSCDACGVEESEYDTGVYANLNLGHMAHWKLGHSKTIMISFI